MATWARRSRTNRPEVPSREQRSGVPSRWYYGTPLMVFVCVMSGCLGSNKPTPSHTADDRSPSPVTTSQSHAPPATITTAESLDAAATSTNAPFVPDSEAGHRPPAASVSASPTDWQQLFSSTNAAQDPFETVEIDSVSGAITIMPRPNAWYQAFRGGLLYRPAEGNFVARAKIHVSGRNGRTIPEVPFSLAGLLIRSADANSAGENFVFHTLGVTELTGGWQFQNMSTVDGQSRIDRRDATDAEAELLVARFRSTLQLWARQNAGVWIQLGQLDRPDLPEQVQVGLMASTDWPACEAVGAATHNSAGVANGRPDLIARFTDVQIEPLLDLMTLKNRLHAATVVLNDREPMVADPPPSVPASSTSSPSPTSPPSPTPSPNGTAKASTATDDLAVLSDEFDDPKTLARWLRVYQVEKSGADQLQSLDIDRTTRGWMTLVPYTSSWYRDLRGVLVHKNVRGDFIVTTRVRATNRAGNGPPSRQFSLAGIMVRTPREITPQTWQPGGEDYIFLSLGAADQPSTFQFEVKTTLRSDSQLEISAAPGPEALIRVARIGAHFILLKKPVEGGAWTVHRRYERPDMPAELQVGMTVYTDWQNVERIPPAQHNRTVIRTGNPDLMAAFEYFRFRRPALSAVLRQRGLRDVSQIADDELARLLDLSE